MNPIFGVGYLVVTNSASHLDNNIQRYARPPMTAGPAAMSCNVPTSSLLLPGICETEHILLNPDGSTRTVEHPLASTSHSIEEILASSNGKDHCVDGSEMGRDKGKPL
eukprot:sb/3477543/